MVSGEWDFMIRNLNLQLTGSKIEIESAELSTIICQPSTISS